MDSFKHTEIVSFKEKSDEISEKLKDLYNDEKGIFIKLTDKKEIKYSSLEICFYFLLIFTRSKEKDNVFEYRSMISNLYKKFFISSGLVYSWPEAPSLDETERYRGLSLHSQDMLDESYFRMPNIPSPESAGLAPLFAKNIIYSRKKDSFTRPKDVFDSYKNVLIFFLFIHYFMDDIINEMNFDATTDGSISNSEPDESSDKIISDDDSKEAKKEKS
jgi:hypothetical protein